VGEAIAKTVTPSTAWTLTSKDAIGASSATMRRASAASDGPGTSAAGVGAAGAGSAQAGMASMGCASGHRGAGMGGGS
jgi:hypothetical protein